MVKLSVAITTYNHEKYIAEALDSIYEQKVNFEFDVVIGNDSSTDNTLGIIKHYQDKYDNIKLLNYPENIGYTKNLDKTLRACPGEYIAIFDGDDIMKLGKLQMQVDFLDKNPDFVMSAHKTRAFNSETGGTIRYIKPVKKKSYYTVEDLIKYGSIFANSSKVFRKSAYPENGIDYNIKKIADYYITVLIARNGKVHYSDECLLDYRVHPKSIMNTIKGDELYNDVIFILNKFSEIFSGKYDNLYSRQLAYAHLVKGIYYYQNNNKSKARKCFMKSVLYLPTYSISPYIRFLLTFLPKNLVMPLLEKRRV